MKTAIRIGLAASLVVAGIEPAWAQRGGGRAGGARGGGGPAAARPSFNRTPSMAAPGPAARPQAPAARPQAPAARPSPLPAQAARPAPQPATRPGTSPAQAGGNRPAIGNNTVNRPGIGSNVNAGNVANRPNIGNNVNIGGGNRANVNRPNIGNNTNIYNRTGGLNNSGNITVNNINNTNNRINANRPAWTNGNPSWAYRPGWNYHQGWVNGYWHGQNNSNWWNSGGAFWTGMAIGGIGAWGIGSAIYNWGYMPYVNPYAMAAPVAVAQPTVIQQPVAVQQPVPAQAAASASASPPVDYSQPLTTSTPPPDPAVADPAIQTFEAARVAFKAGNYAEALRETDQAIKSLPNDAALHEFRALCLFALKQYDQAAGTLYAVLSAGPGWDWTTLSGLYPGVDTYTEQLRALEDYVGEHPSSAQARFVLAYHYLTQGHNEAAVDQLKQVVQLQPSDKLSAQMVAQLSGEAGKAQPTASGAPPAAPTEPAASAAPPPIQQGNLVGTWKASPGAGTTIELNVTAEGDFKWNVIDQGKSQPIEGKYTYGNGILALSQNDNNALVGKVTWQDANHFRFQAMGGPGDPGLLFSPKASN